MSSPGVRPMNRPQPAALSSNQIVLATATHELGIMGLAWFPMWTSCVATTGVDRHDPRKSPPILEVLTSRKQAPGSHPTSTRGEG